jgi:integrase
MASRPPGGADVAAAIARYAPCSLAAEVATFARDAVTKAAPSGPARAKALLFAAGKLGTFATSVGLELRPEVVLCAAVIERFIVTQGTAHGPATRRTLRSNLRFLSAACITNAPPAPVPLSRERAKAPYGSAEVEAYLALADAQPTQARKMRFAGLIVLGAGAGLRGTDLRAVCGTDVVARSGGVVVHVKGRRARVVPVLARYHERLVASARFAGLGYVTGGFSASRRNVTSGLVASLAGGADLPTLDVGRLRATWLREVAGVIGLKVFMDAAGITCSQRLGDLVATVATPSEPKAVSLLGAATL